MKPSTDLAELTLKRTTPRPAPPAPPVMQEAPRAANRQANRRNKVMVAAHFDSDVSFAMRELCARLTRQRGERLTMQTALGEAIGLWFSHHGVTPPDGLLDPGEG